MIKVSVFRLFRREICSVSTKINMPNLNQQSGPSGNFLDKKEIKKALVVTKVSCFESERLRNKDLDDQEFENTLRKRGSDYDIMKDNYSKHKEFEQKVVQTLEINGIETKVVNRYSYTESSINWADIIVPTGGDGTFLLAASRVPNNMKPVIGFNSSPTQSEGHLCLPKKYSFNISEAIGKILKGQFDWKFRNRIRITLTGEHVHDPPLELHEDVITPLPSSSQCQQQFTTSNRVLDTKTLPCLALNEVFIGEKLSARVSFFELQLAESLTKFKVKSSGLCVSTGTGSTSWHLSINRITQQTVSDIMKMTGITQTEPNTIEYVTNRFNESLIFKPDDVRMCYTVRDLISAGVWPSPKGLEPRDYTRSLQVRSRCFDAGLVIDGGISYSFNDGTIARMEMHSQDALRTVQLHED